MANKNNNQNTLYNKLSILITQDGFLFYLHHDLDGKSKSFDFIKVSDILSSSSLNVFKKQLNTIKQEFEFKSLKVSFSNSYFALVPKDYYSKDANPDYLKYNVQLFEEDQIVAEFIKEIEAYQVYIPLMNYHNVILEFVKEFEFEHFTNSLIKHVKSKIIDNGQRLSVFIQNNQLYIIAFEGQKFKLCNSFNFETDLDLAYYILFSVEELRFNQKNMQLKIYHSLDNTSWIDILKRYILNVKCEQKNLAALID